MEIKRNPLLNTILKRKDTKVGIGIITFFLIIAIISFVYLPYNPLASSGPDYSPPSLSYLFGTTNIGQDVFSQWMYGTRATLLVGFLTAALATLVGTLVGIIAGYSKLFEEPLMRITDAVLALPTLPLLIVIAAFIRPSIYWVSLLIAVLSWPGTARVIRSNTLILKSSPYIEVALLSGTPRYKILFKDFIKHLLPLILAYSMFAVIGAILTEASLDFIGVGPINDYSWGAMISLAFQNNAIYNGAWWWLIPPGISIALLSTGFALVAYGLEDSFRKK